MACGRSESKQLAEGAGTAIALTVGHSAWRVSRDVLVLPPQRCRTVRTGGELTVQTRIDWEVVRADGAVEKVRQQNTWRQDVDGNRAYETRLEMTLPDGRPAIRSSETRMVDGRFFRAIDRRFADADLVPNIERTLGLSAFADVDALLSRVTSDGGQWRAAAEGERGLCVSASDVRVPRPERVELTFDTNTRSGQLIYGNGARSRALTVAFEERVSESADRVLPPERIWPVRAEPYFENAEALLVQGFDEGWLAPPRVLEWMRADVDDATVTEDASESASD